jgi:cytochrome oxidase Cu insertion factor (SCO1/SenC/PrrC family)
VNVIARRWFVSLCCFWLGACATTSAAALPMMPVLDLTLARANGTQVELAALSGKPTLLFLFATYDGASQFALAPLVRFVTLDTRVQVIGIALQPDAKDFLDLYQQSLAVPFALYFDPENHMLRGETALGRVPAVPMFVALDAQGRIRDQYVGVATAEQLHALADSAAR